ncbi:MAG: anthranilate synthase component 2 [Vicingaceae bacterium]|jgi:anthranilate synthase component 2
MNILLIDNYDSFTFNLFHYLEELNEGELTVVRNDEVKNCKVENYDAVVISPGPGLPSEAGELMSFLGNYATKKPILGVCLGLQAIAEHFEMELENLEEVVHGQSHGVKILKQESKLFKGLPERLKVGRYHSWVVKNASISTQFDVTAETMDGKVMAMEHKTLPICAMQFHPESILTEFGKEMLQNWLRSIVLK